MSNIVNLNTLKFLRDLTEVEDVLRHLKVNLDSYKHLDQVSRLLYWVDLEIYEIMLYKKLYSGDNLPEGRNNE